LCPERDGRCREAIEAVRLALSAGASNGEFRKIQHNPPDYEKSVQLNGRHYLSDIQYRLLIDAA